VEGKRFSIPDRLKSFRHAFNGLRFFLLNDHNGRVHLLITILTICLSFYLQLSSFEWIVIISMIAVVFVAEIFNASIEKLADVVSIAYHPKIKIVKDLAAAAVLVSAFLAVVVGGIIFIPKIF